MLGGCTSPTGAVFWLTMSSKNAVGWNDAVEPINFKGELDSWTMAHFNLMVR